MYCIDHYRKWRSSVCYFTLVDAIDPAPTPLGYSYSYEFVAWVLSDADSDALCAAKSVALLLRDYLGSACAHIGVMGPIFLRVGMISSIGGKGRERLI